mmetsp:Transcript_2326/g.3574  ORF Transcript_2326/g.3574 Transcript_2326/m.3574 type:complete len:558 (+) Transcript_2326:84-1757(+)|eukprot:CAMPEP_0185033690 /NCGR_PEP_ID=MMETSP1103-20130426/22890_1 /TAXON_ID=36769 /ORGANISM="Paraphysomonas bandaiensis, Strain Caron Lab Isolate" /LENGTH=557 /DNA_ID=CAMNT_0027570059 /DNA_START=31 /DNA_END=1704 /DNA_ORIENTATION=-
MHIFSIIITGLYVLTVNAHKNKYTCKHTGSNDFHFRGTALGGWMVLEPWITPSLFYQFLGASEKDKVGMDSMSFCEALGPEEANKQLRRHWQSWVTEDIIKNLHDSGATTLRIPVGDWMYEPYEPYPDCWEGSLDEIDRVIALCKKYKMGVLIDVHAMKDSQNGLDNSGETVDLVWHEDNSFEHWDLRSGDWVGHFNRTTQSYTDIDRDNLLHGLRVIKNIVQMYKHEPTVVGVEPVNEPWEHTPIDLLKEWYWHAYQIVQEDAPHWITLFHDSFRLNVETWGDFLKGCPNFGIDTHIYQAWAWKADPSWFIEHACTDNGAVRELEQKGIPVVVGEWSLATDNCAMWLNGFNDNLDGYPKVECEMVACPEPYMGQPGAPPDPSKGKQGPFGTGDSTPDHGMCPIDQYYSNEDEIMHNLAMAKLNLFDLASHGQFFWNFRTELEDRWSFQKAVARGWLPSKDEWENNYNSLKEEIVASCQKPPSEEVYWTSGMIIVTVVSVLLVVALACSIGMVACRAAERSDSFCGNCINRVQAYFNGYSPVESQRQPEYPPALEMR